MIDVNDRGFLLGDGLFETIKIVDNKPEFLNEHLARLAAGASVLNIPIQLELKDIETQIDELIEQSAPPFKGAAEGERSEPRRGFFIGRLTLTRGPGQRGLTPPDNPQPTLLITVSEYQPLSDLPLKLFVSSIRRNEFSPTSQLKTLSYMDNILARMEALKNGADEALMLNTQGFVACAASGNIFIEKNGILITPPLSEGVLPGIMRAQILMNHSAEERRLTIEECLEADAVYVTNVLIGMKRVKL